ncbi:MAG: CRISPR-associated endonuclease Cas2 [Terriglobia bacterium]
MRFIQYSVFECELTFERAAELMVRLKSLIDPRSDRLHMYPLCDSCGF